MPEKSYRVPDLAKKDTYSRSTVNMYVYKYVHKDFFELYSKKQRVKDVQMCLVFNVIVHTVRTYVAV